jgi:hypothetical protein
MLMPAIMAVGYHPPMPSLARRSATWRRVINSDNLIPLRLPLH